MNVNVFERILQEYVTLNGGLGISARITHQNKELFSGALGLSDLERMSPYSCDAIVRIFSLTKMMTAVCALRLYEEGCLSLDDKVSKFLPAFEQASVLSYDNSDSPVVRPAKKSLRIRHLFTMTAGYAYPGLAVTANTPRRYVDAGRATSAVFQRCSSDERERGVRLTTANMAEAIASIPMAFEPGEGFLYGLSADILGAVVSAAAGMPLSQVMEAVLFRPLGLTDTSFFPAEEQMSRLAVTYNVKDPDHAVPYDFVQDLPSSIYRGRDSDLEICVGGLYGTLKDYSKFMQMLSNGGSLNGVRVLGRKTVELMTMDHLTARQYKDFQNYASPRGNASWGLMTRVTTSIKDSPHSFFPGTFGWGGAGGALAIADPKENLTITLMTQRIPADSYPTLVKLAQAAYAALD